MTTPKSKKLSLKPGAKSPVVTPQAEQWINSRNESQPESVLAPVPQKSKRITFDVTDSQHRAIKSYASQKGMTVRDLMIELIEEVLNHKKLH